jgi:integrase/recombinase XerD
MDPWAWAVLAGWTADRAVLPPGALFCVIDGPTRGRAWCATAVRAELRHLAVDAGVRRRFAPHQLRHAHAVELLHEGIPLPLIQRQLGHAYLSTTGTYLEGISSEEIIGAIHGRKAPMMHASTARVVAASLLLREGSGRRRRLPRCQGELQPSHGFIPQERHSRLGRVLVAPGGVPG